MRGAYDNENELFESKGHLIYFYISQSFHSTWNLLWMKDYKFLSGEKEYDQCYIEKVTLKLRLVPLEEKLSKKLEIFLRWLKRQIMRVFILMTFIFSVAYKEKSPIKHEEIDYIFGDFRKGLKHDNKEIIGTNE